jgi:RNA-directed DNA polymerase
VSELTSSGKPFDISKWEVWEAWKKVKANKGAPGGDGCSIEDFETDLKNNLALLLYMWMAGVWYGSFRLTGPQASMTVASAASALWKP